MCLLLICEVVKRLFVRPGNTVHCVYAVFPSPKPWSKPWAKIYGGEGCSDWKIERFVKGFKGFPKVGGWGGWVLCWPQPGNRFVSFVRASGRGEAKLCGRARGDSIVKLGLLWDDFTSCSPPPSKPCRVVVSEKSCFYTRFFTFFADNPCKTNVKTTFSADNLAKPM